MSDAGEYEKQVILIPWPYMYSRCATTCSVAKLQWNLSITDSLGTALNVLIKEVFLFQRYFCTLLYVNGTVDIVLI